MCSPDERLCRLNATPHTYWQTALGGISVGSSNITTNMTRAAFDTGTSIIVVNPSTAAAINNVSPFSSLAGLAGEPWLLSLVFCAPGC